MSDVLSQEKTMAKIVVPFGRDIQGNVITLSPKEIVHMLIAGATGSGKSVFIHSLITSLIYKARPDQVKLMLVDPKRVELSKYKAIPHLLCPIISDFDEAKVAVERLYIEMENRYKIFQAAECTSLDQYLQFAQQHNLKPLPYIFAILDEYNDLVEGMPQVSDWVQRIAQKSRAAGIHIVLATQRPTTNVVTGNVKNNMVTKVALRVASPIDSMTVLGHAGSEVLMGNGDMFLTNPLFNHTGEIRVQGAYISDEEIMKVTQFMREKYAPDYYPAFLNLVDKSAMGPAYSPTVQNEEDELYDIVCEALVNMEFVSLNAIMTTYGVGFNRAKGIFKRLQAENKIEIRKDNLQNNRGAKVLIYQGKSE
jgi:S-DNA-T family DNA segregation ATPase FtsK/SpoIIIE